MGHNGSIEPETAEPESAVTTQEPIPEPISAPIISEGENIIIDWRIQGYDDMEATVGDKVTFNWNFVHDVYIHPSGTCDNAEAIEVGTASGASYTFTEDDVGEITFVCNIPGHCFAGQILKVIVSKPIQEPITSAPIT